MAWSGPFHVAFWHFTKQPIQLQSFVKLCYAAIAHIAFHACLTTYLLFLYANFQRFISKGLCINKNRITVLSKMQSIQLLWTHCLFLFLFITRHFKKCGVLCYTPHSKNCVWVSVCLSVCLYVRTSVRPSVSASFSLSAGSIFKPIFFKLAMRVDIGKECPG